MLGYPENGPYAVAPARFGETRATISEDSYGNGPVERTIVALRGAVRSGNSGGPLVDAEGRVVGTVFAATTTGPPGGFAIPAEDVARRPRSDRRPALDRPLHGLSHDARSLTFSKLDRRGASRLDPGLGRRIRLRSARISTPRSS